jgi:hypothetical protein
LIFSQLSFDLYFGDMSRCPFSAQQKLWRGMITCIYPFRTDDFLLRRYACMPDWPLNPCLVILHESFFFPCLAAWFTSASAFLSSWGVAVQVQRRPVFPSVSFISSSCCQLSCLWGSSRHHRPGCLFDHGLMLTSGLGRVGEQSRLK